MKKPDPTLTRFHAKFGYTESDKYKMEVGFESNAKGAEKPATPKDAILAAVDEMVRIAALFGYGDEAMAAASDACKRVAEWQGGR